MRRVPFQEKGPPKVKRFNVRKMSLQLAPFTHVLRDNLTSKGFNPRVTVTVKPKKTIGFVKAYLRERYKLPVDSIILIQRANLVWKTEKDDEMTLAEVYFHIGSPEVFRLAYEFEEPKVEEPKVEYIWDSDDDRALNIPDDDNSNLLDDDWYKDVFSNDKNDNKKRCRNCFIEATLSSLFMCGGCRKVVYCSKECQKADWLNNHHKSKCSSPSSSPSSSSSGVGTQGTPLGIKTKGF